MRLCAMFILHRERVSPQMMQFTKHSEELLKLDLQKDERRSSTNKCQKDALAHIILLPTELILI